MVAILSKKPGEISTAPKARGRKITPYILLFPGMAWLTVFFIVPLFSLVSTSLMQRVGIDEFSPALQIANYTDAITTYSDKYLLSFKYAGIATVLALAIAYPLAYFIAFKSGKWKNFLLVLVVAPFFASFLIRTYAWQTILTDDGVINQFVAGLGILPENRLLATPIAVVAGLTYNFLPFMTLPLYSSLDRIDPRLIEAANDLYAKPFAGFRKVTVPLSMPGVVAGTLLTFIPAAGDYINAVLLGGPNDKMIGYTIQARFVQMRDYPTAAALSFILLAMILILVMSYVRKAGTEELL
ncbi:MAG: ABC transporter permease [Actinobacteria bacterium]|nr:ABC transporter permease [Actinomycetota bacterium]